MGTGSIPTTPPLGVSFAEFLATCPPEKLQFVSDLSETNDYGSVIIATPDIRMHCPSSECDGVRTFRFLGDSPGLTRLHALERFLTYACRNCLQEFKVFALRVTLDRSGQHGTAIKFGELPGFGPPTPARLISLIGPDREIFLAGRRCENRGLGIGAFAYYRRVVEHQKGRIIQEMARVAKQLGTSPDDLKLFEEAARETQFSNAIDKIKTAIPPVLRIDGHNPLTLLHDALSDGLHERSDAECLECATEARVVLTELAERMSQVLKDNAELKTAVTKLLERTAARNSAAKTKSEG